MKKLIRMLGVLFIFAETAIGLGGAPPVPKAPTIFIAATASYGGNPEKIRVRGATNLPPGSILSIGVYDFIGQGSKRLNATTTVKVSKDGFFDEDVEAAPGESFHHNIVCDVSFMPKIPSQPSSVLAVVGREGEFLGSPRNPQVEEHSGEYYLTTLIHVP